MITLVLGGARSGKSQFAERLALAAEAAGRTVTYVATASISDDPDFEQRVRRHRDRRPASWRTDEPGGDLVGYVEAERSRATLLIDSLGTWVAALPDFAADGPRLGAALSGRDGDAIVVSEEVGLGVHPSTEIGGRFRDVLGEVNQAVAAVAGDAFLVVAGRALPLMDAGPSPAGGA